MSCVEDRNSLKHVLLTVDVEDWFQVENFRRHIAYSSWSSHEMRVETNTRLLLDFFDSCRGLNGNGAPKVTFFVLGWLARKLPGLVREIQSRGHEVASHGYLHRLTHHTSPADLQKDLKDSKQILEDILGSQVLGYRAPNFSISKGVLEAVEEAGYRYDSSFNSFRMHGRYGWIELRGTKRIGVAFPISDRVCELPISNLKIGRCTVPVGGGAYFRFLPVSLFALAVRSLLETNKAYVFYIHPWEIDHAQPRVKQASWFSKCRHYHNLKRTLPKLRVLMGNLRDCRFVTCRRYLTEMGVQVVD